MSRFTAEKNVPMPAPKAGLKGFTAQLRSLEVGDSFAFPAEQRESFWPIASRLKPMQFASRKVDAKTVRIWRLV